MSVQPSPGPRPLVNSGQAWLGPIPQHWTTKRIKFQFSCVGGGTPSKDETSYWAGIIPWASPKDFAGVDLLDTEDHITEEAVRASATRVVAPGSLLMVVRSGVLRHTIPVAINRVATALNQDLKALVPGSLLQPEYLKYLIVGKNDQLLSHWSQLGCTVESLDTERVLNTPVPVPPRHEQAAIVRFLDRETARIDALIEKKRRLIELLQEKRSAVTTHAVTRGLDTSVRLRDSGSPWIGPIPHHWDVCRVKMVARLESGHTPSKSVPENWEDCDIPWVSLNDSKQLARSDYISETAVQINKLGLENSSARILPANAVVFTRDATIGLAAITTRPMAVSQHLIAWIPGPRINPKFLLRVFNAMKLFLDSYTFGATIRTIGMPDVKILVTPVPPLAEQAAIADAVDRATSHIDQVIERTGSAIDRLSEYRSALISAAVTGQIDVRKAA